MLNSIVKSLIVKQHMVKMGNNLFLNQMGCESYFLASNLHSDTF